MYERQGSDVEVIERARQGDMTALESLTRAHQEVAFRTALVVSGGSDDAEDAVQEAFMKAFAALSQFRAGAPFRPWLLAIVANEARNRRRAAGRRDALALRVTDDALHGDVESAESTVLARERRSALMGGLSRLREADREVVALRYIVGLSEAETAAAIGVPAGTVKSRLSRALERLRGELTAMEAGR